MPHQTEEPLPRADTRGMADMLAKNARVHDRLPRGTDFTKAEYDEIQNQVCHFVMLCLR